MDLIPSITERLSRIHPFVWLLGAIGFGALLAVFVFSVSVGTVTNFAILAFFWGGHMFMHRSHGHQGHGSADSSHRGHNSPASTEQSGPTALNKGEKDPHHSKGCH